MPCGSERVCVPDVAGHGAGLLQVAIPARLASATNAPGCRVGVDVTLSVIGMPPIPTPYGCGGRRHRLRTKRRLVTTPTACGCGNDAGFAYQPVPRVPTRTRYSCDRLPLWLSPAPGRARARHETSFLFARTTRMTQPPTEFALHLQSVPLQRRRRARRARRTLVAPTCPTGVAAIT